MESEKLMANKIVAWLEARRNSVIYACIAALHEGCLLEEQWSEFMLSL